MGGHKSINLRRMINKKLRASGIPVKELRSNSAEITDKLIAHLEGLVQCQRCNCGYTKCTQKYMHNAYHYIRYKDIRKIFR